MGHSVCMWRPLAGSADSCAYVGIYGKRDQESGQWVHIVVLESRVGRRFTRAMSSPDPSMSLPVGKPYTGILEVLDEVDENLMLGALESGHSVLVAGKDLPREKITVYNATVQQTEDLPILVIAENATWHVGKATTSLSAEFVDLCSGFGGMGFGMEYLGFTPLVRVDSNSLAVSHLRRNSAAPVIQLDITHPDAAQKIHRYTTGTSPIAIMGFPCEPDSRQGARGGAQDSRSKTLEAGLEVIHLIQCQAAILESVPQVQDDPYLQGLLNDFATRHNWEVHQIVDLADQWPMRRRRWWGMLLPKAWVHHNVTQKRNQELQRGGSGHGAAAFHRAPTSSSGTICGDAPTSRPSVPEEPAASAGPA